MNARPPTKLGTLLVSLRTRRRVSQKTLASQSGVSRAIISILERGYDPSTKKPPHPRPETLRLIAIGLSKDGAGDEEAGRAQVFYADLMQAAGYGTIEKVPAVEPESPATPPVDDASVVQRVLEARYGEDARFVAAVLDGLDQSDGPERQTILRLLVGGIGDALGRPSRTGVLSLTR